MSVVCHPTRTSARAWPLAVGFSMLAAFAVSGCEPEKPPAPATKPAPAHAPGRSEQGPSLYRPDADEAVLTYAAERGSFTDGSTPDDVPEQARGMVRVALLAGAEPPPGSVWVANLRTPDAEGRFVLETVPRDLFEELALGQGLSSAVELPAGLEPPENLAAKVGEIIVYKTSWCGVCKKLEGYLDRKGVEYVAKDIEKDRAAAAELQAKASDKGIKTGSVPVIDVGGELLVGFDRARLEKLLG